MSYINYPDKITPTLLNQVDSLLFNSATTLDCSDNISKAVHFHLSGGGSKVRAKLTLETSQRLGIIENDAVVMGAAIECLHNASLIHDDYIDKDKYRRNQHALWYKYNDSVAVCSGDMMIARAFGILSNLSLTHKISSCLHMMSKATETTIAGQSFDMDLNRWNKLLPSQYCNTVALKSVPLIQICMAMPIKYKDLNFPDKQLDDVFIPFATAYQIIDDIKDWHQDKAEKRCNYISILSNKLTKHSTADLMRIAFIDAEELLKESAYRESHLPAILNGLMSEYIEKLRLKIISLKIECGS